MHQRQRFGGEPVLKVVELLGLLVDVVDDNLSLIGNIAAVVGILPNQAAARARDELVVEAPLDAEVLKPVDDLVAMLDLGPEKVGVEAVVQQRRPGFKDCVGVKSEAVLNLESASAGNLKDGGADGAAAHSGRLLDGNDVQPLLGAIDARSKPAAAGTNDHDVGFDVPRCGRLLGRDVRGVRPKLVL